MGTFNRPKTPTRINGDCLLLKKQQANPFGMSWGTKEHRAPNVTLSRAIAVLRRRRMENASSPSLAPKDFFVSIRMASWFGKKTLDRWIQDISLCQARNGVLPVRL
jgi:hypothetical protein